MKSRRVQTHFPDEIEMMVSFLNAGRYRVIRLNEDVRHELRGLIDEWLASKSQWSKFLARRLKAGKSVASLTSGTFYLPGQSQEPIMVTFVAPGASEAEGYFQKFIFNRDNWRLGGPCRCGCGRYFERKTAHERVYADGCRHPFSNKISMRNKRDGIREKMVGAAKCAVATWERKPHRDITWEQWVANEANEWASGQKIQTREVTDRMIRGWVEHQLLKAPTKVRATNATR